MAAELEQEPDLNKAPPHLEGYLLKQRQSSVLKKGWKKFFFIVIEDHLKYYRKKEDYEAGKEPISLMRLSQVKDITEAVFDAVPKKHHLNCGFSLVAFTKKSQHEQTFNLLAETTECKRRWVRGLRYIKSYWSKRKIRETIISEEKEREFLDRILKEDEDDGEVLTSNYWEESWSADGEDPGTKSFSLTVYLGRGSKVATKLSPSDTTSDLLESVKEQLTSSSTLLWLVDQSGTDTILEPQVHPAAFLDKAHKFYALDPSQRVLVVFYGEGEFEALAVSSNVTAEEVVNDTDIQIQLDKTGINNSGLFLKTDIDERLFGSYECPCDVLFTLHSNGQVVKLDAGRLVVKNKALHRGKMTVKLPKVHRAMSQVSRTMSNERREMEEISEEEDAQAKALYLLLHKKQVREQPRAQQGGNGRPATIYDEDWIVMTPPDDHQSLEPGPIPRARSTAISSGGNTSSPQSLRKKMPSANSTSSPLHSSPSSSSPSREGRGRCKSPRLLPAIPALSPSSPEDGQGPLLQRRNASKKNKSGPTIHIDSEQAVVSGNVSTLAVAPGDQHPALSRTRSPTIRRSTDEHGPEHGGSVLDKFLSDTSGDSLINKVTPFQSSKPPGAGYRDNEDRLERLFDRSHQLEMEERTVATATGAGRQTDDSLQSKMAAVISSGGGGREGGEGGEGGGGENSEGLKPMVIDVSSLAPPHTTNKTTTEPQQTTGTKNRPPQVPMEVRSPNILKVVLLASESTASDTGERTMDLLSLSGVVVKNDRGAWHLVEGSNFHDPLPFDCSDHTETLVLPGGIRAVFNHSTTPKRWHMLPPPPTPSPSVDSRSESDRTEHAQNVGVDDMDIGSPPLNSPQFYRKRLVTEVGAATHEIVSHFEKTRDIEEKKRIGSDMINNSMGYTVRGRLCSALAGVILEGLRPYRIQRLILNNIWKVTMAFCQEVQLSEASLFLPQEVEKLVQVVQAIGSLRALRDNNTKFRTFVCLCLSRGLLCKWLQMLPHLNDTLSKYYQSWALLVQATDIGWNQKLYSYMLQDLEPLNYLPFDLSIDFEGKQELLAVCPEMRNYSRIPTPTASPNPSPRPSPHSSPPHNSPSQSPLVSPKFSSSTTPPRRLSVTVVKNAATGQRTNNLIAAVWQEEQEEEEEETDSRTEAREGRERRECKRVIEEPDVSMSSVTAESERGRREGEGEWGRREGEGERRGFGRAASWLRKIATNLQEAAEAASEQPKPHPPPTNAPSKKYVQALYSNIAEDGDELSFSEGDVMTVTGQVNSDWLICSSGQRTGIVPANFVQEVKI